MTATDEYLANNARYAETVSGPLPMPPSAHLAVVACMDARLNVYGMLGLGDGEAHVIRNAGGVITDDEIRSLAISQRLLGTREIMLIHHTDCGMLTFTDDAFKRSIQDDTGIKPAWGAEAFLLWPEISTEERTNAEHLEEVSGHRSGRDHLRAVSEAHGEALNVVGRHTGEEVGSLAQLEQAGPGVPGGLAGALEEELVDLHQPIGLVEGERPDQRRIDDRVNGRVQPDAEREGQDDHRGEATFFTL